MFNYTVLFIGNILVTPSLDSVGDSDPIRALLFALLCNRHNAPQAERTDKDGAAAKDQFCDNCKFIQADSGQWRPCQLFPGVETGLPGDMVYRLLSRDQRWAHLPCEFIDQVSRRIINEIKGVSRVTCEISGKPPATIEWE